MIRIVMLVCALFVFSGLASAQMTVDQKVSDFTQLAATYAKNYAPYEWKVLSQKFDLYKIKTWLDRVKASKDDLEFMDICVEYVASLNDAHDFVQFQSDFAADLGFSVDLFDGVYLIDFINRAQLRTTAYPFQNGDELISIDGVATAKWVQDNLKYGISANPRSSARWTADLITFRPQATIPGAVNLPDRATVVIKRQSGTVETYNIPWAKSGTPLFAVGPVPGLNVNAVKKTKVNIIRKADEETGTADPEMEVQLKPTPVPSLSNLRLPENKVRAGLKEVLNLEAVPPVFAFPAGFTQRLGRSGFDYFSSGTYTTAGSKIGYIRIPTFLPSSEGAALNQFVSEITYMQANTDGLIVDVMRNGGGDACYAESLLSYVIPTKFRTIGYEIRATASIVSSLSGEVEFAKSIGAEPWMIRTLQTLLDGVKQAYSENRGRTGPIPVCDWSLDIDPALDRNGRIAAYSKPMMLVTDEMSISAAEMFAAVFQDNQRGIVYGMRTMGAGGAVNLSVEGTTFSESLTNVTISLMNRKNPIVTSDYPTAPYVENIGVRPDIEADYMTKDNLLNRGKTFVDGMFAAMASYIKNGK
jgi:Peptidase family S41